MAESGDSSQTVNISDSHPLNLICGTGTRLEVSSGKCILDDDTKAATCGEGTRFVNGQCKVLEQQPTLENNHLKEIHNKLDKVIRKTGTVFCGDHTQYKNGRCIGPEPKQMCSKGTVYDETNRVCVVDTTHIWEVEPYSTSKVTPALPLFRPNIDSTERRHLTQNFKNACRG